MATSSHILNYELDGNGPPLVLLHGWGVSFTIWRELRPLLRRDYTLILPEMPGVGKSPPPPEGGHYYDVSADALEDLRQHLRIDTWSVLGYSLGGWVARAYAQSYPEALDRLIFLCLAKPMRPSVLGLSAVRRLDRTLPQLGDWLVKDWRLHALVAVMGFNGRVNELSRLWTDEIGSQPTQVVKQAIHNMPTIGRKDLRLPESVPTRFIWGRTDIIGFAPLMPSEQDIILPGNHSLPMTDPGRVAQIVREFLSHEEHRH